MTNTADGVYDFVIIGSGFGGSVSALRLTQKGYRVLVLERGKRFRDQDFARSNWNVWKYLWLPALRCFGILQISVLNGLMVLHGAGVGGGSLGYANVLMEPDDQLYDAPGWRDLADWKTLLRPHFQTARRILGVSTNPRLWPADAALERVAAQYNPNNVVMPADVGVFFGDPDHETPDPYFNGEGQPRRGCNHCGGCMVGCRHNAKNTLVKNYLYLAEKQGAQVVAEREVSNIEPLPADEVDGAHYRVTYRQPTAVLPKPAEQVRARHVIISAGVLGTLELLFRCRDITRSMPHLSRRLGDQVRTNSEAIMGAFSRTSSPDYSQGIAITSVATIDATTRVEPVRYPAGSSLMRLLSAPLIEAGNRRGVRLLKSLARIMRHPRDHAVAYFSAQWARHTTILLVMQTRDTFLHLRLGRAWSTLFRRGLVTKAEDNANAHQAVHAELAIAHDVTKQFANEVDAMPFGSLPEGLLNLPTTAHILGGCPFGRNTEEGVIDLNAEVHGYPGLYVVDGSIMPANPGINPSLTITALAEYVMSLVPAKHTSEQS